MATPELRPDLGEMYKPEEAAVAMRVGRATVYRLIKSGDLKASKIGSQYRISGASLAEYLDPSRAVAA